MDLYFAKGDPDTALKYLMKAAKNGYAKAYGEIGIILNREKNRPDEAEEWFIKAERSDSLFPAARYEYGMLHYLEKDDWETGLKYLLESAHQGYELAYGDIGSIIYMYRENIDEACCLDAPQAHDYGMLLIEERGEIERGKKYLKMAEEGGFNMR
ncbi:Sel1 domain protein repeat-containing protein [Desulfosarcina variabilis str. Montpellier]